MTTVQFFGEQFALREKVSDYALMKFARAARNGQDGETMEGMASMLDLLEKCIVPEDWKRFDKLASDSDAPAADIMAVIKEAFGQEAARPTELPSDSSDGPTAIEPKSPPSSDGNVSQLLRGRPDLQAAVRQAQTA
jgi:hypothetical protein